MQNYFLIYCYFSFQLNEHTNANIAKLRLLN